MSRKAKARPAQPQRQHRRGRLRAADVWLMRTQGGVTRGVWRGVPGGAICHGLWPPTRGAAHPRGATLRATGAPARLAGPAGGSGTFLGDPLRVLCIGRGPKTVAALRRWGTLHHFQQPVAAVGGRSLGGQRLEARGGFFHMHMGRALQRWQESAAVGPFLSFQQPAAAGGGRSIGRRRLAAGVGFGFCCRVWFDLWCISAFLGIGPTD